MVRFAPFLFVFLWSTGFIGARLGLPHAGPLTFLLVRYLAVLCVVVPLALAARARWPEGARAWLHLAVAGVLIHAAYLGGVFVSIAHGMPAGLVSLVVGLQPLLTAVLAALWLGERILRLQWVGLALGLAGTTLVLAPRIGSGGSLAGLPTALLALVAITVGTLYQRRHCPRFDWRVGASVQFAASALATLPLAFATEAMHIEWTGEFAFALAWLVFVLSLGAVGLLNRLIRSGSAVHVASLFYLVPPTTAFIAFLVLGESLTPPQLLGFALAVAGVALARRNQA